MKNELTQEITLDTGVKVTIPVKFNYAKCRGCPAEDIIWATTLKNKKLTPIRFDTIKNAWISHFSDCVSASKFRKK